MLLEEAETPTHAEEQSLRERTRHAVQNELAGAARELFIRNGFDATTVDDIAQAAGISRRSFFRYFPSKHDVLLGQFEEAGLRLVAALSARPVGEPIRDSLRLAFEPLLDNYRADPVETLAFVAMLRATPSLQAAQLEKQHRWQQLLSPEIARRMRVTPDDPRPAAIAGSAIACLEAAVETWTAVNGAHGLDELLSLSLTTLAEPSPTDRRPTGGGT